MSTPQYPLAQVALIKAKKLEESEKILQEKRATLAKEEKKLEQLETERNAVKEHREAKLAQLREELDTKPEVTSIQQMKSYLKEVDEQLKQKEAKVTEQKKKVTQAQKEVDLARQDMLQKQQDVEKLRIHREEWNKEQKVIQAQKEAIETDDIGTTIFSRKKPL